MKAVSGGHRPGRQSKICGSSVFRNTKKEAAALRAPRVRNNSLAITASEISVSVPPQVVKGNFPDVLPKSVLRHFGYISHPEGMPCNGVLFPKGPRERGTIWLQLSEETTFDNSSTQKKIYDIIKSGMEDEDGKSFDAISTYLRKDECLTW